MSGRTYRARLGQGIMHIDYTITMKGAGAAAPTLGEGDVGLASNLSQGTYVLLGRTGVGVYTIKTLDPFAALVGAGFQVAMTTPAGNLNVTYTFPGTQNADKTWTVTLQLWTGTVATELASGNSIIAFLTFRNSIGLP